MERRSPRNISSTSHRPAVSDGSSRNFGATWDTIDSTHLLPSQPLKHIPRAWERKPQSPAVKNRHARKIWRRHDFPQTRPINNTVAVTSTDQPKLSITNARLARIKALVAASPSPRKVVKKRCVHTDYGQSATANHWDQRHSTPLRKKVHQRLLLDKSPDLPVEQKGSTALDTDPALKATPIEVAQHSIAGGWPDAGLEEDEENVECTEEQDSDELAVDLDLEQHKEEELEQEIGEVADEQEQDQQLEQHAVPVVSPKTLSHVDELEEAVNDPEQSHLPKLSSSPIPSLVSQPQEDRDELVKLDASDPSQPEEDSPLSLTSPDVDSRSPIQRPVSAPPGHIATAESRPKPRVSDDTAILHAFLNRAAASKKPSATISKRESLTNRRDSDAVRLALASPAKADVLADLDPNSPSPKKSLQQRATRSNEPVIDEGIIEAEEVTMQEIEEDEEDRPSEPVAEDGDTDAADPKPMRRSIRSRNRVVQFPPLVASPSKYAAKGPNKITIRSAGTPVAIKRTDAQELSLATRTNTRKNKGGSIMPILRLLKLGAETTSPEPSPSPKDGSTEDELRKKTGKNVKWDSTLAYYQMFADDSDQQEARRSVPGPAEHLLAGGEDATPVAKAPTPMKPKARRLRTPSKSSKSNVEPPEPAEETVSEELDDQEPQAVTEAVTKAPTPAPKKRRSRIATPAKGLLSAASLLPADVLPSTTSANSTEPNSTASSSTKTRRSAALSSTRSLAAPKKLTFDTTATASTPALPPPAAPSTQSAPDTGKENRTAPPLTPNKKSMSSSFGTGIPPPPAFHKSTSSLSSSLSGSGSGMGNEQAVPGLASPAKKRLKSAATATARSAGAQRGARVDAEAALPGLASPAKRRVRARVL